MTRWRTWLGPALQLVPCALAFTLLPGALAGVVFRRRPASWASAVVIIGAVAGSIYVADQHGNWRRFFPDAGVKHEPIAHYLRETASWDEMVFSSQMVIPEEPPQLLSISRKRVWKETTLGGALARALSRRAVRRVGIVTLRDPRCMMRGDPATPLRPFAVEREYFVYFRLSVEELTRLLQRRPALSEAASESDRLSRLDAQAAAEAKEQGGPVAVRETTPTERLMLAEAQEFFPDRVFLSIEDTARFLGCDEATVYNWLKRPDSARRPPRVRIGKETKFPRAAFVRWLAQEQG